MLEQLVNVVGNFLAGGVAMTLYWCAAVAGTLFFLVSLFFHTGEIGMESMDLNADGVLEHMDTGFADFQLISLKSILAFVTLFGWTGVVWGKSGWIGFLAAFVIGLIAMFLTALSIYLMYKLQHSGNVSKEDFLGKVGTVYFTIPAGRTGNGKVTVSISGSTVEISAVAEEEIQTGTAVKIDSLVSDSLYLVRKV